MWNRSHGEYLINLAIALVLQAAFVEAPFDLNQRLRQHDWKMIWEKYTCAVFLTIFPSTDEETWEVSHMVKYMAAESVTVNKSLTNYQLAQYAGLLEMKEWPASIVYFGSDHRRNVEKPPTCRYAWSSARSLNAGDIEVPGFYLEQLDVFKVAVEETFGRGEAF